MGTKEFNVIHTYIHTYIRIGFIQKGILWTFFGKLNKGLICKFRIV